MIPLCDLKTQYLSLKPEIDAAMQQVAGDTKYIMGPHVKQLEQEMADACGCTHGLGLNSGTDSLHLALRGLNIGPGDEVITTPFTFIATTEAIGMVGAKPVFVDIDPETFNIDPSKIEAAITPRTKVILPVHIFGQPCEMDAICDIADRYGLRIVEDCAQALGAAYQGRPVGSFGAAGCISFFPSKNLGGFGDGGMLVTNDDQVAQRVEMLRRHGGRVKYHHEEQGVNSRLDELQAAILRVKLPHLSQWCELRRRHALRYNEILAPLPNVLPPREWNGQSATMPTPRRKHNGLLHSVYHQYTVLVEDRVAVMNHLRERGVGHAVYYPVPLHLQKVHADLGHKAGDFPCAEYVSDRCLSLPIFPELSDEQQDAVCAALAEVLCDLAPVSQPPMAA